MNPPPNLPRPRLALYQPDIAGNVGTILRLSACMGVSCDIIMPCGFAFSERGMKRAGMDYALRADMVRHDDWNSFAQNCNQNGRRIILLSSGGSTNLYDFAFTPHDVLLLGRESAGAPDHVAAAADARVHIPMMPGNRSLNISVAAGIALGEALRQTGCTPAAPAG